MVVVKMNHLRCACADLDSLFYLGGVLESVVLILTEAESQLRPSGSEYIQDFVLIIQEKLIKLKGKT